jgi:hypothetical protein
MNTRKFLLLVVAGLIAYGAWHVSQRKAPSTEVENALLYPGLLDQLNDSQSIEIQTADDKFTLRRDGERWSMVERNGYPVHVDKVREALFQLAALKVRESKTSKTENYPTLGVSDTPASGSDSRRVTVRGATEEPLADLLIGKARQAKGLESPGHYVRRHGDATAYLVEGDLGIAVKANDWIETAIVDVPVDRVRQVTIGHYGAPPVTVSKKDRKEQLFTLQNPPEGYDARSAAVVSSIGGLLLDVRLEDVIAASRVENATPRTIVDIQTFDGLGATLEQYDLDGRVFVTFKFAFNPDPKTPAGEADKADPTAQAAGTAAADANAAPDVKAEVEALDAKVRGWAYELPDYKTRIIDKKMEDLIKVKGQALPPMEPIETME